MAKDYYVTSENNPRILRDVTAKGDTEAYSFDFTQWQEERGVTLTGATWTLEDGDASISGAAFTSGVATANINFPTGSGSLISIAATDGTLTKKVFLDIVAKDPDRGTEDYGLCR